MNYTKAVLSVLLFGSLATARLDAAFITNGGFESGFSGWTRANQTGSEGTFQLQTGTSSPLTGTPVPAPPGGTTAAMTDAEGPGSHALYQSFTATSAVLAALLEFDLYVGNQATAFSTPTSLDFSTPALNQQARVDLLAAGADPFSVATTDILLNAFRTQAGDPLVSGYTHYSVNITSVLNSHLNAPLTLRFAEVDNVNLFQFGVDNVNIVVQDASGIPEPSTWWLVGTSVVAACARRFRKRD